MKKLLFTIVFLLITCPVFAQCDKCNTCTSPKCMDLKKSMHNERATLYNVLNLSDDQQKCKDTIDKNYNKEVSKYFEKYEQEDFVLNNLKKHNAGKSAIKQQEKLVNKIEKDIKNLRKKYDKEFKSILNSEQKSKFNTISKMENKTESYCKNQKAYTKRDPKYRKFGENMYYGDTKMQVCPVHNKRHLFGKIHTKK